jgi:hypothetical protein
MAGSRRSPTWLNLPSIIAPTVARALADVYARDEWHQRIRARMCETGTNLGAGSRPPRGRGKWQDELP